MMRDFASGRQKAERGAAIAVFVDEPLRLNPGARF
jgi:hypothetical protein